MLVITVEVGRGVGNVKQQYGLYWEIGKPLPQPTPASKIIRLEATGAELELLRSISDHTGPIDAPHLLIADPALSEATWQRLVDQLKKAMEQIICKIGAAE